MNSGFRCVACGRSVAGRAKKCPFCHACLLVDVMVDSVKLDRRSIYLIAKKIDLLGDGAPEFDEVRMKLRSAPSRIAMNCPRLLAHRIGEILRRQNVAVYLMPLRRPHRRPVESVSPVLRLRAAFRRILAKFRMLPPMMKIAGVILLIIGFALPVLTWKALENYNESLIALGESGDPPFLSNREVAFLMLDSAAEVYFGESSCLGFFVSPDLLLSKARFLGSEGESAEVVSKKGERFTAWVLRRDDWHDIALLRIVGGEEPFLKLSDGAFLERGEALSFLQREEPNKIRVREGIVMDPDQFNLGRSYILLDAEGASEGSPVSDGFGRVVGIVTAGVSRSEGKCAVIPINYLVDGEDAMLRRPMGEEIQKSWRRRLKDVAEKDRALFESAKADFGQPVIVQVDFVDSENIDVMLVAQGDEPIAGSEYFFELGLKDTLLCRLTGHVTRWDEVLPGTNDVFLRRRLLWLRRHARGAKLYTSVLRLVTWACPGDLSEKNLLLGFEGEDGIPINS